MFKKIAFALCLSTLLFSCQTNPYTTDNQQGIIISYGERNKQKIRLEPITDAIFRVSAVPEGQPFSTRESLMREASSHPIVPVVVAATETQVRVSTCKMVATVDRATGRVVFTDLEGNVILAENEGGGKSFSPIEVEGDKGYSFRQVFESPDDEALYGLGQHQSDEFNYKGKNEVLYQYNTKVSVPFIVSNKHYGLLWDNMSLTKFGDVRDYAQLNTLRLYDKQQEAGALTATYESRDGKTTFVTRREGELDYEDLEKVPRFPQDIPFYNTRILWEGEIEATESGIHRFILLYAGYTKVFVDNKEVVAERWRTAWNPNSYKFSVAMEAGKRVPIRVEWIPDGGVSYISLKVLTPIPEAEQAKQSWWSEMGDMIDYYVIYGTTSDEVISGYRTLTGKAPIMPKWAMGYWQSRERYKTSTELLDVLKEYRKRRIPLDNMVQDWSYWPVDAWGSHEFDKERFPDPKGMVDSVHAMNGHLMISVWPKFYHTTDHYKEFADKGWMYLRAVQDSVRDWIYPGYIGSFYDAYSAEARQLFWNQMNEHLYSLGMDAWWMDASEPDIVSNHNLDYRKALSGPTALGSSTRYLNAYALVNAMAIYDGQRATNPNSRVFLLTRSGFPGLQRYSTATWSGDIGTCWEDMKTQISAGLNFSLSGIPYWTMDIGGFSAQHRFERAKEGSADLDEWREMNTRWFQFGAFCPLFRSHGQYPLREIFNLAPESHPAYKSMVEYDNLRYRLMPYIYALCGKTWLEDYTIMRALAMDFAQDTQVLNISDQYMFGPAFMVCPVYTYKARTRSVYLPSGADWYSFNEGTFIKGGQTLQAPAPYHQMPLYVKAGSIVPVGPQINYAMEKPEAPITLYVYTGADGRFSLYEDEGINYNYEKGAYSVIPLSYEQASGQLTIGAREGSYEGMPQTREFRVVVVTPEHSQPFNVNAKPVATVTYDGKECTLSVTK